MEYKNLSNKEYWNKRTLEQLETAWAKEAISEKDIQKYYLSALEDIKNDLASLLGKYGDGNTVPMNEMNKLINKYELKSYLEYIDGIAQETKEVASEVAQVELKKLSMYRKMTRLQAQTNRIEARLIKLGVKEEELTTSLLEETYIDNYYKTIFQLQTGLTVGTAFTLLNSRAVEEAIRYQWSGSMFSDLIWANKDSLLKNLRETITNGLIRGDSYWKMASNLDKAMDKAGYKNALRIIRTETAHVINEATAKGYEESGLVDQYIIIATLDRRTSKTCQHQDGEIYKLKDKQVGKNFPPFHPNCRTAVAPYFEDDTPGLRIARGLDSKTYYVDASMTYKDWSEKYLNKK